jgi:thioredoxin-like negative regulator of GroEL
MTFYFGLLLSLATTDNVTELPSTSQLAPVARQSVVSFQPVSLIVLVKQRAENKAPAPKEASKTKTDPNKTKTSKTDAKPQKLKPVKRRVLVFKAEWCAACQQLSTAWPSLRKVKWRIGTNDTDHFQLIDVDRHRDLMNKYGVNSLPTVILIDGEKVLDRRGVLSSIDLAELYYGRLR